MAEPILDLLLEDSVAMHPAVLALVSEASRMAKKKRKPFKREVRRGNVTAKGDMRWWLPIPLSVWEELERPEADIPGTWDAERFRSIYGVPKMIFDELVAEARQHPELAGTKRHLGDGKRCKMSKPLELKVAAVLEMNQAGLLFKTASRLYKISETSLRSFYHDFMRLQVQYEYEKHVYVPSGPERTAILEKHARLGFPGCLSGIDGVKLYWSGCSHADRFTNTGKEGKPTRLYNVAGDCTKVVHHVHGSHPGGRNDLTTAKFDEYMTALHTDAQFTGASFPLYTGNGQEMSDEHGLYSYTDNGYHKWRISQFGSKVGQELWLKRWSKRGESFRKPSTECIYGILKKRFRSLALPVPFTDPTQVDNLFRFCISLHNRLQRYHGLHTLGDLPTDWELANVDRDEARLIQGSDGELPHIVDLDALGNVTVPEFESGWGSLRAKLITHFRIAWQKKELLWLKPASEVRPGYLLRPPPIAQRYASEGIDIAWSSEDEADDLEREPLSAAEIEAEVEHHLNSFWATTHESYVGLDDLLDALCSNPRNSEVGEQLAVEKGLRTVVEETLERMEDANKVMLREGQVYFI